MDPELVNGERPAVDGEMLSTAFCLVDVEVEAAVLDAWPQEWRVLAYTWAALSYLEANDNDVEVPECPYFVPLGETDKRLIAAADPAELVHWYALTQEPTPDTPATVLAEAYLPRCFGPATAKRALFEQHPSLRERTSDWVCASEVPTNYNYNGRMIHVEQLVRWLYYGDICRLLREPTTGRAIYEYELNEYGGGIARFTMLAEVGQKWSEAFRQAVSSCGYRIEAASDPELGVFDRLVALSADQSNPAAADYGHGGYTGD